MNAPRFEIQATVCLVLLVALSAQQRQHAKIRHPPSPHNQAGDPGHANEGGYSRHQVANSEPRGRPNEILDYNTTPVE